MRDIFKIMLQNKNLSIAVLFLSIIFCLSPFVSPAIALFMGIVFAQIFVFPFEKYRKKTSSLLLQASVVGLGFGMNMDTALQAGKDGFVFTVASIFFTLLVGYWIGKLLKIDKGTSYLISCGTAICGGSAIAAISPVIRADEKQMSVSLGIVFVLNAVALFIFPSIGHFFQLSEINFGYWSAIAIHDTSSVVGAASKYGDNALEIATTVKLTRALWIIPLSLFSTLIFKNKDVKIKIPYFIGFFILAIVINSYVSGISQISPYIVMASKKGLTLSLFIIGSGLSRNMLKSVGIKPLIQGVLLWLFISISTLMIILFISQ